MADLILQFSNKSTCVEKIRQREFRATSYLSAKVTIMQLHKSSWNLENHLTRKLSVSWKKSGDLHKYYLCWRFANFKKFIKCARIDLEKQQIWANILNYATKSHLTSQPQIVLCFMQIKLNFIIIFFKIFDKKLHWL